MLAKATPEQLVEKALIAIRGDTDWHAALDVLPVPVYTTDTNGAVTYWNKACVDFAGREPELGSDRWCVTWKLYTTTGEHLPHAECPMAEAVKEKRPVYGKVAIALRPDGSRRAFTPYPTPLFDRNGDFTGAVNILIDITHEQASELADQAARCRRLAQAMTDRNAVDVLTSMASGYSQTAASLNGAE